MTLYSNIDIEQKHLHWKTESKCKEYTKNLELFTNSGAFHNGYWKSQTMLQIVGGVRRH